MKILIFTDAWDPQVNGVVTTYKNIIKVLEQKGHTCDVIHPSLFRTRKSYFYKGLEIAKVPKKYFFDYNSFHNNDLEKYDRYHIATEGPIGREAKRFLVAKNLTFTTSFHTDFTKYAKEYAFIPEFITNIFLRNFHKGALYTFVPSQSVKTKLIGSGVLNVRKIKNLTRGFDPTVFNTDGVRDEDKINNHDLKLLYVGRVSKEKNIEAFLREEFGFPSKSVTKIVVGDGPELQKYASKYPDVLFKGELKGEELAKEYKACNALVFPSLTDTFGIVIIEALACGLPVIGYKNANGISDIIKSSTKSTVLHKGGILAENNFGGIELAVFNMQLFYNDKLFIYKNCISTEACANIASKYTWEKAANQFLLEEV